ncbi:hypothetical protein HCA58_05085 [Micromonospora sp. HNM0581]|uniref:hypothetical protein n=1 Tax=Micromonospora sp. HNM0581 TaxID=2716341 RepID=UPI00146C5DA0|nr:hypothetical protein [Micromonospora sp. HNM0581]NLU77779.1 hypothetical protein [Micromonospora sp. HNM0581]
MGKHTIKRGLRAVECRPGGACYDGEDRCLHCRAHIADPHGGRCLHADEPADECDARPVVVSQAVIELRSEDNSVEEMRRAVEVLLREGFDVRGPAVAVFRKAETGPLDGWGEWIGVVTVPKRA